MKSFLAVTLLALSLLLLGTLLQLTSKDLRMTTELLSTEQAYYLAEAGLARAERQITLDPLWRGEWKQVPFGAGTYSVKVSEQAGKLQIEAIGEVGKMKVKKLISKGG